MRTERNQPTAVSLDDAVKSNFDLIVICSKTQDHLADLEDFINPDVPILLEKPVVGRGSQVKEMDELTRGFSNLYVSFPLRFTYGLARALSIVNQIEEAFQSMEVTCKSWLPDWRPDRDHTSGYWAETGSGGVVLELVHEFDYASLLAGGIKIEKMHTRSNGVLGLSVPETAYVSASTPHEGQMRFCLDFSRRDNQQRQVRVAYQHGELRWDILRSELRWREGGHFFVEHFPQDSKRDSWFRRQYEELFRPGSWPIRVAGLRSSLTLTAGLLAALEGEL